jgi:hypothetical protein
MVQKTGLHPLRRRARIGVQNPRIRLRRLVHRPNGQAWAPGRGRNLHPPGAVSYKNLFDPSTGFFRAKNNSTWHTPFDPFEVNFNYTEANAWQYRFAAPQDVSGMMGLMGGRKAFAQQLDALFTAHSKTTGRNQADITGLIGQYVQGNEPSHHMAYLYNYCRPALENPAARAPDSWTSNTPTARRPERQRRLRPDVGLVCLFGPGFLPGSAGRPAIRHRHAPCLKRHDPASTTAKTSRYRGQRRLRPRRYIQSAFAERPALSKTWFSHERPAWPAANSGST